MTTLEKIKREKIITIIRGVNVEDAISVTKAIRDGGLCFVEVTFNQTLLRLHRLRLIVPRSLQYRHQSTFDPDKVLLMCE